MTKYYLFCNPQIYPRFLHAKHNRPIREDGVLYQVLQEKRQTCYPSPHYLNLSPQLHQYDHPIAYNPRVRIESHVHLHCSYVRNRERSFAGDKA